MKPPERESGGMVAQTAARMEAPTAKSKADAHGDLVNVARESARFYFARHERTGDHLDIRRATMMQAALVALLEARRP